MNDTYRQRSSGYIVHPGGESSLPPTVSRYLITSFLACCTLSKRRKQGLDSQRPTQMESNDSDTNEKRGESTSTQPAECTIPTNIAPAPIVDDITSIDRIEKQLPEDCVSKATSTLVEATAFPQLSRLRTVMIVFSLTGVTFTSSLSTGLVTIGIPRIADDLHLADHLILW